MQQNLYGALGAGGTKMICGIVDGTGKIIAQKSFPTTTPKDTFPPLLEYFKEYKIVALGIGSFGPVDVRLGSVTYGNILHTPKEGWKNFSFLQTLAH